MNVNFDQSIPGAEELATEEGGVSTITAVDVGGPVAACPVPVQLPHGIVWSWSTVCDFASFLRPIVLALAWLAAGMLVLGGKGI
ncbi:MAG: virulence factor TspB C-terminal domain-related protein [Sulfuritalea sp.]|nr:virulence factor TspB C-terminal domain-related protein [Sulfuritalea sp.]